MPGKYLEFVKSGRYAVPVEISFLPVTNVDEITGKETSTTKWIEKQHWKEIKTLLKPAVDACTNVNTADGFSKSPHVSQGQEISLGYILCVDPSKEKSRFLTVLDAKKNCWTDDEDDFEELDEFGLRDYGGTHRSHTPTKIYVKACIIKRTSSAVNDSKKLKKELGFNKEDLRSYFQASPSCGPSSGLSSSLLDKDWINNRKKRYPFCSLSGSDSSLDPIRPLKPVFAAMDKPGTVCTRNGGTYYEEQDEDDDSDVGYKEPDLYDNQSDLSDEDTFSLPDLDAPQLDILMKQQDKEAKMRLKLASTTRYRVEKGQMHHRNPNNPETVWKLDTDRVHKIIRPINPAHDQFAQLISRDKPVKKKRAQDLTSATGLGLGFPLQSKKPKENVKSPLDKKMKAKSGENDGESVKKVLGFPLIEVSKNSKTIKSKDKDSNKDETGSILSQVDKSTLKKKSKKRQHKSTSEDIPHHPLLSDSHGEIESLLNFDAIDIITSDTETPTPVDTPVPVDEPQKKKAKKKHVVASKIKNEKSPVLRSAPAQFEGNEFRVDQHHLVLDIDPEMPVLLPEALESIGAVNNEGESEEEGDIPIPILFKSKVINPIKKKSKKEKPVKVKLPKKNKTKEKVDKSTSTQVQTKIATAIVEEPNNNEKAKPTMEKEQSVLIPVDRNVEVQRKMVENFMEEDDDTDTNSNKISKKSKTNRLLDSDPSKMMPPPSRPAPRTPKKDDQHKSSSASSSYRQLIPMPMKGLMFQPPHGSSSEKSHPSKLSTVQLLSNPKLVVAGVTLLNKLGEKKITAEELGKKMGFKDLSKDRTRMRRQERELSPDITALPYSTSKSAKGDKRQAEDETETKDQEEGETLMRELLDRVHENSASENNYEPNGDEFDLSQKSMCYLSMIPDYSQKSRSFKIHCKNVTDLKFEKLIDHYNEIRPNLRQIFEGETGNNRSALYMQGQTGRKRLQDMSVSIPFDHDQTSSIISMLLDYFIPEPARRPLWSDYINYVLLPEALIHIYARVNDIPYEIAEKEMRYQGCYDDAPAPQ